MGGKANKMKMETIYGSRTFKGDEGLAVRLEVSARMMRSDRRVARRVERLAYTPDRLSVAKAMEAIERRLVDALWTLARLPNDRGVGFARRHGVGYLDERADLYANAVANGGWLTNPPPPPPPSGKAIDAMDEPLEWLRLLERSRAKLLSEGAMSRCGNMENPVRWRHIQAKLQLTGVTIRTMQRWYESALRELHAVGVRP